MRSRKQIKVEETHYCYNTLIAVIANEVSEFNESAEDYADELFEALAKDDTNLADYTYDGPFGSKLHKVTMSYEWVDSKLYGLATCEVDDDWTDEDTEQLKEYLTGQYSDGWGEGFEQREVYSFTETETAEEFDEDGESYLDEYGVRNDVYISFWQDKNFRIMTVAELKGCPPPVRCDRASVRKLPAARSRPTRRKFRAFVAHHNIHNTAGITS